MVDGPGAIGLNTFQSVTLTDASGSPTSEATTYDPNNNQEFVLAESVVGVGTDYYFDKPNMARGDSLPDKNHRLY